MNKYFTFVFILAMFLAPNGIFRFAKSKTEIKNKQLGIILMVFLCLIGATALIATPNPYPDTTFWGNVTAIVWLFCTLAAAIYFWPKTN